MLSEHDINMSSGIFLLPADLFLQDSPKDLGNSPRKPLTTTLFSCFLRNRRLLACGVTLDRSCRSSASWSGKQR